jgi:6-phosphofructokinase 1
MMKRIGVLTSGGDVPGLNACIRAVTRMAVDRGVEVVGVQHGFTGLIKGEFTALDQRAVGGILQRGGTILGTARCKEFETDEGRSEAIQQLSKTGIDGLVVIGGNGSLTGAMKLNEMGVPLIGIPKTIDNDQFGTDIAIGVDTALNTIVEAVGRVKDTASSHHRAFLVETMGRDCGYLALASGIASGAEMALIPEHPATPDAVAKVIETSYRVGKAHCIIMVAEGWEPGTRSLQAFLNQHCTGSNEGFDVREVVLGHIQRGGTPSAFDRILATRLGAYAVERLLDCRGAGMMAGLHGRKIDVIPLREATSRRQELDPEMLRLADILAK